MSVRELARVHRVHRRTVRTALTDSTPPPRKAPARVAPAIGPWLEIVRAWLVADLDAPRKQRHTARRLWQRLMDEYGATVAESTVCHAVAKIRRELIGTPVNVAVPQTHAPGAEAEVDFGEFKALTGGAMVKLFMFVLRLSFSGRAVHVACANQAQESFLDGHYVAFERLGGIPSKMIHYDNLTPAVIRIALGRDRVVKTSHLAFGRSNECAA